MSETKIYNLRIVPPKGVFEEVTDFKKQFIDAFGKQPLSKSKPHITLAIFEMDVCHHHQMLRVFNQLSGIEKFKLDIQGFGSFEGRSNVLLLKIGKNRHMAYIHEKTDKLYRDHLQNQLKGFKISSPPHMTISKTQGRQMLHKSLAFFDHITYVKQVEVDQLTLVSRYPGKTWDWEQHITLSSEIQQTLF